MTVILQLANISVAQGYDNVVEISVDLTNSGTENVEHMRLKVVDSEVFDKLHIRELGGNSSCLNVFSSNDIFNTGATPYKIAAGTTETIKFSDFDVKSDAPIQDHPLVCYWQYICY